VPAGATRLCHATASKPRVPAAPDSATVGTSGNAGWRLAEVTASARNLPERTCCTAGGISLNITWIWIDDCAPGEFVETVLGERVDLGVGTLEAPTLGLVEQVFLNDWLSAVAPAGPAFPAARPITWKQLAAMPVITVKAGYGVRRRIDRAAAAAGVQLQIVHEVSLLTTAVAMAASGLGVAVVPGSILTHTHYPALVSRELVRPKVERNTAVIFKQDRWLSPPAQAFADLLAREFGAD
jgi:LysR family carnitine catabolism transcriptional activator